MLCDFINNFVELGAMRFILPHIGFSHRLRRMRKMYGQKQKKRQVNRQSKVNSNFVLSQYCRVAAPHG